MTGLTYGSYLRVPELLSLQNPVSDGPEHDEMLFIVIHQTYELWFKQILHELSATQTALESGEVWRSVAILGRIRTILKTMVSQVDILETMTPLQFNSFRERLESSSGFQSSQFREFEAVLGRRGDMPLSYLPEGSPERQLVQSAMERRSLWGSVLVLLSLRGFSVPRRHIDDVASLITGADPEVQILLADAYRNDNEVSLLLERLVDVDEGVQEWRYRHVKMVERTIGTKSGTGGSSGAGYLVGTLFRPLFPDLWEVRNRF
ncbi:MAG: tryptophan 2,3-dioxygenase [Acidimicrobiales bacterium]